MSSDFYTQHILPYAGIIIKICRAYSNSQEDFEDYYQEVCLQIWRSKDKFKGQSEWSTWIYRLSLNVCLTMMRKETNRQKRFSILDQLPDHHTQDMAVFADDALNQLYRAIKQLSATDRAVILLHLEEKSHQEIAEILSTNANNIGVKILRIKERLKKLLNNTIDHGKIN